MNPRLSSYFEAFEDFYPDATGHLRKKIILKVSDYRSALIQGKFFAKKGCGSQSTRIESGLNCGGHAFPSDAIDGSHHGRVQEEPWDPYSGHVRFVCQSVDRKEKTVLLLRYLSRDGTGGVGTSEEHELFTQLLSTPILIGWGTPFLLVPEATT